MEERRWPRALAVGKGRAFTVEPILVALIAPALVVAFAVAHAVGTRRLWKEGAALRTANVRQLLGEVQTYNVVWGFDTKRAVTRISRLRGEAVRPKVSPHFVLAVSSEGLWLVHGARGDRGVTAVHAEEFRSIETGTLGPSVFTAWFIKCVIRDQTITLPVRVSDPSSDFLNANFKWAETTAGLIAAQLGPESAD